MRALRFAGTFVLFSVLTLPCFAQSTGANVMSVLGDNLRRELAQYHVEGSRDIIRVLDRQSGAEVMSVRELGPQDVTITATVGVYPGLTSATRASIAERIALFNFSSSVGTLELDERTGMLFMSHHLNPTAVSMSQMVHVASLCGEVAREQSRTMLR